MSEDKYLISPEVIKLMAAYQKEIEPHWQKYLKRQDYQLLVESCRPAMQRWIRGVEKLRAMNPNFSITSSGQMVPSRKELPQTGYKVRPQAVRALSTEGHRENQIMGASH